MNQFSKLINKFIMLVLTVMIIMQSAQTAMADVLAEQKNHLYDVVVEPQMSYKDCYEFNGSVAIVEKGNNQKGVINVQGKEVVPCNYKFVQITKNNIWVQEKSGNVLIFNFSGEKIKSLGKYKDINIMDSKSIQLIKGKTIVLYSISGKKIVKSGKYIEMALLSDGKTYSATDKKNRFYLLNSKGKVIKKFDKKYISVTDLGKGYIAGSIQNGNVTQSVLMKANGKKLYHSSKYLFSDMVCNGKRVLALNYKTDKFELLSLKGKKVTTFTKADMFEIKNGIFSIGKGKSLHIVNAKNKPIIKKGIYSEIVLASNKKNYIAADYKSNYYLLDSKGNKIVSYGKCKWIRNIGNGYIFIPQNQAGEIRRIDGTPVMKNVEEVSDVYNKKIIVKMNGKWGVYSLK